VEELVQRKRRITKGGDQEAKGETTPPGSKIRKGIVTHRQNPTGTGRRNTLEKKAGTTQCRAWSWGRPSGTYAKRKEERGG